METDQNNTCGSVEGTGIEFQDLDEPEISKEISTSSTVLIENEREKDEEMSYGIIQATGAETLNAESELLNKEAGNISSSAVLRDISVAMTSDHEEQQSVLKSNENVFALGDDKGIKAVETILSVQSAAKGTTENLDQKTETKCGDISKDFMEDNSENLMNTKEHTEQQMVSPLENSDENQGGWRAEGEETISAIMDEQCDQQERPAGIDYNFAITPHQVTGAWQDFSESPLYFLKGCKWSPDGSCLVTASEDNILRIFNLPVELFNGTPAEEISEMLSVLKMLEGETIYDYAWYPYMSSLDPDTCCLLSSSRDHPVHMWDAFNGSLRCSYRSYDHMDEIVSPNCVAFNLDGSEIYCGFNNMVRVFNTARPGRECQNRPTLVKKYGQHGIISSIAFCPDFSGLYALGSYSKTVGLYSDGGELLYLLQGQTGGVTQVMFSQDGTKLYSGGRKDEEILCWDIRNPGKVVYRLLRSVTTNQRMYMDIDRSGRYVISGSSDGSVNVWDTCASPLSDVSETSIPTLPPVMNYVAHGDCVNGVSLHPSLPLLATASGQRKFPIPGGSDSSDEESRDEDPDLQTDNSLRIWALGINS